MVEFKDRVLLVLTNSYPDRDGRHYGGIFVKEQVGELRKHFKNVYVISPQPLGTNKMLKDYEYDNVRVFFPRFLHAPIGYFRKKLGDNFFKSALNVIKKEGLEFDLIHAHFAWPSGYAGVKLGKELGVPVVVTAHGYDVYDLPFRDKYYLEKIMWTLKTCDHVITVSRSNLDILTGKLGVPENRVSLIPNGFDGMLFKLINKEQARKKLGLPSDKKIVLSVGNLVPVKGHEFLIQASRTVLNKRKDVLFVIVGGGPLRKKLENLVGELGVREHFLFAGPRPHEEIPLWMNAADLFVLSSLSEGNPTVMFEALGVGLPFVGTAVGGVPEIITSEDYGLLCPPADPDCLAEKILIALNREWDERKIEEHGRTFAYDNVSVQILKKYREVL
ncbi:glycosyltransferase family 4 protein [Thermococcus sp.]